MLEILARTRLPVAPVLPDELARKDDIGLLRGHPGTYVAGTDFDGAGLPTLQEFLDANINGRAFAEGVTIDNGNFSRSTPILIHDVVLPGSTLDIISNAQFATDCTISGVAGAVRFSGNSSSELVSDTLSIQSVIGSVTLAWATGSASSISFGDVSLFSCRDVRFDPDIYPFRINELLLMASAVILQGQGAASHQYARTKMRFNSRLEIHSNLGAAAVTLNADSPEHGFVIDYREPSRPLETFARKADTIGSSYGASAPSNPRAGMLWARPGAGCAELSVWTGTEWLPLCGGAPLGPSTWDGGNTVWDGGSTIWDG